MRIGLLFLAAFLASAVEMVEALTIVLAVGSTRGWRSTLVGVGAAAIVLGAFVGALGPALTLVPIDALRLVVGGLLLAFGLQWLRKAILRASGYKSAARRGRDLRARGRGGGAGRRRRSRRARLVLVHASPSKACCSKASRSRSSSSRSAADRRDSVALAAGAAPRGSSSSPAPASSCARR